MDKIVFDLYKRKYFLEFLLVFSFKKNEGTNLVSGVTFQIVK